MSPSRQLGGGLWTALTEWCDVGGRSLIIEPCSTTEQLLSLSLNDEICKGVPTNPWEQMRMGIEAVFRSSNIPLAAKYRDINKVTGLKSTAVNVQAMVYGNINDQSCTGVLFTRDLANGENTLKVLPVRFMLDSLIPSCSLPTEAAFAAVGRQ
ncbi:hypothetical protein PHYPSEUDO_005994 [Phytophthora pseudosyringae]|uniref:Pyruvate phosphate dikinase AMP/ATP-binding domain-containing protein n=1 Tax=Phytophthora pseudosyringae TaxID=221518 RepID=A0A8T1VK64_9STRA|nr:hypothetical protein PHYPSEUDO_005994 [Phytophthora pseudosyringae]